ncbi:MAG: 4a-hydroxytetrahydrobiopterin dehydratase [Candidatus Pacearchaeota archaeon]
MDAREIQQALWSLEGWSLDSDSIFKEYNFETFLESLDFVNAVAGVAEKNAHHPTILVNYNTVLLTLTTHSAGGLTEKDFTLAREIDETA